MKALPIERGFVSQCKTGHCFDSVCRWWLQSGLQPLLRAWLWPVSLEVGGERKMTKQRRNTSEGMPNLFFSGSWQIGNEYEYRTCTSIHKSCILGRRLCVLRMESGKWADPHRPPYSDPEKLWEGVEERIQNTTIELAHMVRFHPSATPSGPFHDSL